MNSKLYYFHIKTLKNWRDLIALLKYIKKHFDKPTEVYASQRGIFFKLKKLGFIKFSTKEQVYWGTKSYWVRPFITIKGYWCLFRNSK